MNVGCNKICYIRQWVKVEFDNSGKSPQQRCEVCTQHDISTTLLLLLKEYLCVYVLHPLKKQFKSRCAKNFAIAIQCIQYNDWARLAQGILLTDYISATKVQNSGDQTRWDRYDKNRIVRSAAAAPAIVFPTFLCRMLVLPKVAVWSWTHEKS